MANETRQVSIFINGKEVENTIKAIASEKRKLNNEVNKMIVGTDEYKAGVKELGRLEGVLRDHRSAIRGVEGAWEKNESAVKGFIAAGAGLFVVDKIISYGAELGKLAVAAAANAEQVHISFETMLGSKAKADQLQAELFELAAKTPFELPQVQDASKKLLAFGFSAKEVVPNLTALGNIAAGVGQEKLPQLILAFGQVKAATRLTGNELRQFTEAGVPLLDALAKEFKKPVSEIQKMVTEGKVGFPAVQKALFDLTSDGGRFANLMEKQSKSLSGLYSTFKDSFTQNVLLPIGEGISKAAKPALLGLTDLTESIGGVSTKADVLRNSLEKERTTISSLVNRITDQNTSNETRKKLIGQLQQEYPSFLGNLKAETATNAQLRDRLQEVNKGYLQKIIAVEASKGVEIALKQEQKGIENVAQAEVRRSELLGKAQDLVGDKTLNYAQAIDKLRQKKEQLGTFDVLQRDNINDLIFKLTNAQESNQPVLDMYSKAVTAAQEKQKQIIDNIAKQNPALAKEINELLNPKIDTKNTEGGIAELIDPESDKAKRDREQEANRVKDALEKMDELLAKHRSDLREQQLRDDERDEERIKEKYRKDIELEIENEKDKNANVRAKAHETRLQLETLRDNEIAAKKKENAEKLIEDLDKISRKIAKDASDIGLDAFEKKIQAIRNKFTDDLFKVSKTEESNDPSVKAKATQTRLDIEKAMNAEIEAERTRHLLELAKAQDVLWQKNQIANAKGQEKELLETIFHFQNLIDENVMAGLETQSLVESQQKALGEIKDKYRKKDIDAEKKLLENKKNIQDRENEIKTARFANYQAFGTLLGEVLGDSAKKSLAYILFMKGLAAAEIIMTAQREAAAIKLSYAQQAVAASLIPGAPAALMAIGTGLATQALIRGGINAAIVIAQGIGQYSAQKADGGYAKVIGQQDGQTYNAKIDSEFGGGLTASPTLLVGERGTEYVVPNYLLRNPMVANFTRIIEDMRLNRGVSTVQRETGGYAATSALPSVVPVAQPVLAQDKSTEILEKIYDALLSGRIIALVDTEGALKIDDLVVRGKKIRGY